MPWTTPITFVAGAILTAAQQNAIQENLKVGGPTYTTETERDAAITSPAEGMRAYITSPEVAKTTATGAITAIPTGIDTRYNGTSWVCITPVGASSNTLGTTTSVPYVTTLTGDGTEVSVTVTTGVTALVTISAYVENTGSNRVRITSSISGATTAAASDTNSSQGGIISNGYATSLSLTRIITGLNAGANKFVLNYSVGAGTSTYFSRGIVVQGIA